MSEAKVPEKPTKSTQESVNEGELLSVKDVLKNLPLSDEDKHLMLMAVAVLIASTKESIFQFTVASLFEMNPNSLKFVKLYNDAITPEITIDDPNKEYIELCKYILDEDEENAKNE